MYQMEYFHKVLGVFCVSGMYINEACSDKQGIVSLREVHLKAIPVED